MEQKMEQKNRDFDNSKLTNAQKYNQDFENLSIDIIKLLFQGIPVEIRKTNYTKDGGYDAVVELIDQAYSKKIYFECKLRSKNLNLRDIAANLIIAFNEGAISLVILTNVDYTEQAGENLNSFCQKTILNIKVLTGNETKQLAENNHISIPTGLAAILQNKKTIGRQTYNVLRLDFTQTNLYKQIIGENLFNSTGEQPFIIKTFYNLFCSLKHHVKRGHFIILRSPVGTGKTTLIQALTNDNNYHLIHIIADSYISPSQFLLDILFDIWGIPYSSIVQEFTDDNIEAICKVVKEHIVKNETAQITSNIIRHMLGKETSQYITDENFNFFICSYLLNIISYHPEIKYLFHIEHIEYAAQEVQALLSYLCRIAQRNSICCIIEEDEEEYQVQASSPCISLLEQLERIPHYTVEIPFLEESQALDFISTKLPEIPLYIHKLIYKQAGDRLLALSAVISYAKETYTQTNSFQKMCKAINSFPQCELPACIEMILDKFYYRNRKIFEYMYLCNFEIPEDFVGLLFTSTEDLEDIEALCHLGFFNADNTITTTNLIVTSIIKRQVSSRVFSLRRNANKLINLLGESLIERYPEIELNLLYYTDNLEKAIEILKKQIIYAKKYRHYTELIKCSERLINYDVNLNTPDKLQLLSDILEVKIIKKEINTIEAKKYMQCYKDNISQLPFEDQANFKKRYDYFFGKAVFKNGDYKQSLELTEQYYKYIEENSTSSEDEWLARLCVIYALSSKELYGNNIALENFNKIIRVFPHSYSVCKEYQSHIGCMNFFHNPQKSIECFQNIIFESKKLGNTLLEIPFHEYVDLAMSAVCAKKYEEADSYCTEALNIIESNGILGELGRLYNIKGCLSLCKQNYTQAKEFFGQAVAYLDVNHYPLYAWRAYLNYASILALPQFDGDSLPILNKAYHIFKTIYTNKLQMILNNAEFYYSREYFAILLFMKVYRANGQNKDDFIISDLNLNDLKECIMKNLVEAEQDSPYYESSYSTQGHIFMIA